VVLNFCRLSDKSRPKTDTQSRARFDIENDESKIYSNTHIHTKHDRREEHNPKNWSSNRELEPYTRTHTRTRSILLSLSLSPSLLLSLFPSLSPFTLCSFTNSLSLSVSSRLSLSRPSIAGKFSSCAVARGHRTPLTLRKGHSHSVHAVYCELSEFELSSTRRLNALKRGRNKNKNQKNRKKFEYHSKWLTTPSVRRFLLVRQKIERTVRFWFIWIRDKSYWLVLIQRTICVTLCVRLNRMNKLSIR